MVELRHRADHDGAIVADSGASVWVVCIASQRYLGRGGDIRHALKKCRHVAMSANVGLQGPEIADLRPAVEYAALKDAQVLLG